MISSDPDLDMKVKKSKTMLNSFKSVWRFQKILKDVLFILL